MDGMSKSNVDMYGVCSLSVNASSVLCVQYGKWIHGSCAGVKRVTARLSRNFACWKSEGNVGEAVEQEVKLCGEVETVREFTYLGDMVNAGGGCETAVIARTRYGWVKLRECGDLLYYRRFPLMLKGAVCESYVRPAKLYGSEA